MMRRAGSIVNIASGLGHIPHHPPQKPSVIEVAASFTTKHVTRAERPSISAAMSGADIHEDRARPFRGQPPADLRADGAGAPRDHRDGVRHSEIHVPLVLPLGQSTRAASGSRITYTRVPEASWLVPT
jgi:hypothetical protein